jgi:hypothetical protein
VIERYEFPRLPADDLRKRIAEWLRFHGFDDGVVCGSPGWIERDPDRYAVRAEVYIRDPRGRRFDRREVEEHRSEGPPLPFPDVAGWQRMHFDANRRPWRRVTRVEL